MSDYFLGILIVALSSLGLSVTIINLIFSNVRTSNLPLGQDQMYFYEGLTASSTKSQGGNRDE